MYMKVYEFRKDLKKYFDIALTEPVYIERGGVVFKLSSFGTVSNRELVIENDSVLSLNGRTQMKAETLERQRTCKNGHPIPEGRDRCLGKGCKYA